MKFGPVSRRGGGGLLLLFVSLTVLISSALALPANMAQGGSRPRESRKKVVVMPAPAVPMARQENVQVVTAETVPAPAVVLVAAVPAADVPVPVSSTTVAPTKVVDTETGSVAPVGDEVEHVKPPASTVKTYVEGEILSTPNPLDPLPVLSETPNVGGAPVAKQPQPPAPVFPGVAAAASSNNVNGVNSGAPGPVVGPGGALLPGTGVAPVNATAPPPTKKPDEEEESSSEEDNEEEEEAEEADDQDDDDDDDEEDEEEDEEEEEEEDEEEEEEEEEEARTGMVRPGPGLQTSHQPTILDLLNLNRYRPSGGAGQNRIRLGAGQINPAALNRRVSGQQQQQQVTSLAHLRNEPGLEAMIPGYVTPDGEVLVPIDTLEQAYPYSLIPDKAQQGRLEYYAESSDFGHPLMDDYYYLDGTEDNTYTNTKAATTTNAEEEDEQTPVRISSFQVIFKDKKNETEGSSAGVSEENQSSSTKETSPSSSSSSSSVEETPAPTTSGSSTSSAESSSETSGSGESTDSTDNVESGVKTVEPESEEEDKVVVKPAVPIVQVKGPQPRPPLQAIPATRPTNEDDEDEFGRRLMYNGDYLFHDLNSYGGAEHYDGYYEPSDSQEYYQSYFD